MSDDPQGGPVSGKQRYATDFEAAQTHHDRRQAAIHTSMPGTIVSFDAQTMTAVVKPALKGFQTKPDGTREPIEISHIPDVPVHFPGGGGHTFTFPVKEGDECLIMFAERSIDNWHQHGETQEPSDWRMHDINDAIAIPGLRSQPNVPSGGVSSSTVQLRSDDGVTVIEIDGANQSVKITAHKVTVGSTGGELGVLGTGPVAKGNITGSKQGNPALTSLLQFLAQRGDLEDHTT